MCRYFVSCFNVTPEFFTSFKFPKSKGGGLFNVKYMEAVFNREAESGEFFIEFDDYVWEHKLIKCFQAQGAGQVTTITFANNDGNDSASSALVRILLAQEKHGGYARGTCPAALQAKTAAKRTEAKQKLMSVSQQEFDEKTAAAIKLSLDHIETGVQSQAVKLEGIHNGVCYIIPDYQKEISHLKEALAHKTKMCDRIEGQKGRLTMEINKLKSEVSQVRTDNEFLHKERLGFITRNQDLQERVDMCQGIAILKQMQEETQHTAEILSSTLAEERASKRQRREEGSHFAIQ